MGEEGGGVNRLQKYTTCPVAVLLFPCRPRVSFFMQIIWSYLLLKHLFLNIVFSLLVAFCGQPSNLN